MSTVETASRRMAKKGVSLVLIKGGSECTVVLMRTGTVKGVVTEHPPQAMSLPKGNCGPSYSAETEGDVDSQFASAGGGRCWGRREGCAGGFSLVGNERHVG